MSGRAVLYCFVILLLFAECQFSEDKQIQGLLKKRERSLRTGDVEAYFSCLSPDYTDSFFPLDHARDKIKQALSGPARPEVRFSSPAIYQQGNRAVVREEFWIEGVISEKPRRYKRTQHLRLARQGQEGWKIMEGSKVYRLLAGQAEEEDEIIEVLDRREKALENKDLQLYLSVVSPRYEHQGQGVRELEQRLSESFRVFDEIRYEASDRRVWFFGNYATVEQRYRLEAKLLGELQVHSEIERFELIREPEGWMIVKGL
jgi:hypothetical protein